MLNERSLTPKVTYYIIPSILNVQIIQIHKAEGRSLIGLGLEGWEEKRVTPNGHGVSIGGDDNVLKCNVVMVEQHCEYTKKLVPFEWVNCM